MSRYVGRVVVDNPDAQGAIESWGFGMDWPCREPRIEGMRGGALTCDLDGEYGWIIGDDAEYIRGLGSIGPRGLAVVGMMDLDEWTVLSGQWRETTAGGGELGIWLHYHDAAGTIAEGTYGYLESITELEPALRVWSWHMPPIPWNTDPAFVDIILLGDGEVAEYALRLPRWQGAGGAINGDARICRGPTLYGRPQGQSAWSLVDEVHDEAISADRSHLTRPELRMTTIEYDYVDGWLLLRFDDRPDPHLFRGPWRDAAGRSVPLRLAPGPIGLRVCGHSALLNVRQLTYPSPVVVRPRLLWHLPSNVVATQEYRGLGSEPPGTAVEAAVEVRGRASRPVVTFSSENPARRGLLRTVQEWRWPEFGAANSEPLSTLDGDSLQLMEMSGECNDSYRGARLSARLEAAPGASLAEIRTNQLVSAAVSADEGESWVDLFTGFVAEDPEISREDASGRERMRLSAADAIEARLPKKFMWGHPSYECWEIGAAFSYILQRAGVRGDLIDVDEELEGVRLPRGRGDERLLAFRGIERVESALDIIATIRGCEWGVGADGRFFLRPVRPHEAGAYDYLIDADATDPEELVVAPFRHARDFGEFANMMAITVGQGWGAAGGWFWDPDSILDPECRRYVGEDWWHVANYPDGDSARDIYRALWERRQQMMDVIYWHTLGHPEIMPGDEVRVEGVGCGIPEGSTFRVTSKAWRLRMGTDSGGYEASYEGVLVEVGG